MGFILLISLAFFVVKFVTLFLLEFGHCCFVFAVRRLLFLLGLASRRVLELRRSSGRSSNISVASSSSNISTVICGNSSLGAMPSLSAAQIAASPRHSLAQFLNNILSMRGPQNLPYEEDVKYYIRQHLLAMVKEFKGLQIKTATFNHNDGRTSYLLQAAGTIPMFYKEVKYNIPVTLWLVEAYPRVAPLVFVTPTRDMIIKPQHRYVDASGTVTAPYLQQWSHPRSNLLELFRSLSLVFGEDPPLYSRPPSASASASASASQRPAVTTPAPSTPSPRASSQTVQATNPLLSRPGSGWSSPAQSASPVSQSPDRVPRPPPYTVDPSTPGSSSKLATTTPEEAFQINAINTLTERLQRDIKANSKRGAVEMDDLFNTQVSLNERKQQIDDGHSSMQREKENLEEQLQLYMTNTHVIEDWLKQNDGEKSEVFVDDMFPPVDALSRQLLESTAADLTIDDTLYSLDRAVQEGSVPWEAYHKSVRQLSREQFYHRATSLKVRATQNYSRVEGMAASFRESNRPPAGYEWSQ